MRAPRNEAMELALKALADYDTKNAPLLQAATNEVSRATTTTVFRFCAIVKESSE